MGVISAGTAVGGYTSVAWFCFAYDRVLGVG